MSGSGQRPELEVLLGFTPQSQLTKSKAGVFANLPVPDADA